MLVRVKVEKKTYQLGGVWGVRIAVKVVRWDDESKAAWPYIVVTEMRNSQSLPQTKGKYQRCSWYLSLLY